MATVFFDLPLSKHPTLFRKSAQADENLLAIWQARDLNPDHLYENLAAIDVQLTPADLRELETALSKITVQGGRMNQDQMQIVDRS